MPLRYASPAFPIIDRPVDVPIIDPAMLPLKAWHALHMIANQEPYPDPERYPGLIYFAEASEMRRVKIGFAKATAGLKNLKTRLSQIQCGCPSRVVPIRVVYGEYEIEGHLHKVFSSERTSGEWFRLTPRLRTFIMALAPLDCRPHEEARKGFLVYPSWQDIGPKWQCKRISERETTKWRRIEFDEWQRSREQSACSPGVTPEA